MRLSTILRALLRAWYLTFAGVLVSCVLAAGAYAVLPPQWTSTGTGLLVQARQPTRGSDNPMLSGTGNVNTSTAALVETFSAPGAAAGLGLDPRTEKLTVKNVGTIAMADGADHPFLYITAQSATPQRSEQVVDQVLGLARASLAQSQEDVKVAPRYRITLRTVVPPTPAQPVLTTRLALTGAVFALGLVATCVAVCGLDALRARARRRRLPPDSPLPALQADDAAPGRLNGELRLTRR
jgi:uncharacterized protein involved in exopolysaccharide biosynthesis